MTDNYPITPPPELIEDWIEIAKPLPHLPPNPGEFATLAARWGSDQELKACCKWTAERTTQWSDGTWPADALRAARRPKPPSLKERALQAWAAVEAGTDDQTAMAVIRRALEALDD